MRGDDVRTWQQRMADLGRQIAVDGIYGPQSARVARDFQRDMSLDVDGVVGPKTWAASWQA
jgi:peptidoglycan hydrolase-like protein with peptidoglycan-binding domain